MITETTNITDGKTSWVFYDGECPLCISQVHRFESILKARGFQLAPLQDFWVINALGMSEAERMDQMWLMTNDGRKMGGLKAIIYLTGKIWWAWPLYLVAQVPGVPFILQKGYRWIAEHRRCNHGTCHEFVSPRPKEQKRWLKWLPLVIFLILAIGARPFLIPWVSMWVISFAIFFGCKWLTWVQAIARHRPFMHMSIKHESDKNKLEKLMGPKGLERKNGARPLPGWRFFGYFFGWVGMDADHFLQSCNVGSELDMSPTSWGKLVPKMWIMPIVNMGLGFILLWGIARTIPSDYAILQGWMGWLGMGFIFHFGFFHHHKRPSSSFHL